jgi:exosortase
LSEARPEARPRSLAPGAAAWLGAGALALLAWREGLAFALSSGGAEDVEHIFFEAAENPPWLISVVAAALLFSRRGELRAAIGSPGSALGSALLLAPGLALLGWGRFVSAPDLSLLGVLAMALGAAWLAFGPRLARLVAVPVALLAFSVPIPGAIVNQLVYPLQLATASYAYGLLGLLGVATFHAADVIRTASHNFLVIEGCSGLGSMEVLALLALAWGWQTRASFGHGLALFLAAPLIAFALNGPRVVGLVVFPDSDVWSVHTIQGVVAFAVGTLLIALLDRLLTRASAARQMRPAPVLGAAARQAHPPAALYAWLGVAALASIAIPRFEARGLGAPRELLPASLPGWKGEEVAVDRLYLGSVRFENAASRRYRAEVPPPGTSQGETVRVTAFIGESDRRSRGTSIQSPKNRVPGRGWLAESVGAEPLPGGYRAERVVSMLEGRRTLAYVWYQGLGSPWSEALRAFLALDQSPWRRDRRAYVVRLYTELLTGPGAERAASRRVLAALRGLRPSLEGLDRPVVTEGSPREGR